MAFLDLDEIEQDSKDANIVPHPLKDKLAESEKAAYINAIVFAGLADDDTLSDIELEYGRTRALSLGLNADDFDEAVKTVQSLNGPKERKEFLFEMLTAFTDRTVAMYVLCDMAQAMASDGDLTDDACKFLDSLYRLLLKSDKKPDNPLTPADQKFLSAYRPFLAPRKTADASEVVQKAAQGEFDFPVGLVDFFSPDLKPLRLEGGETKSGEFSVVGGKYRLDELLTISSGTKLVMHDAEIEMGPRGCIVVLGSNVVIKKCRFVAKEASEYDVMFKSKSKNLQFVDCRFDGGNGRGAVVGDDTSCDLEFKNCEFNALFSESAVIWVRKFSILKCLACKFTDCRSADGSLIGGCQIDFSRCDFNDCVAKNSLVQVTTEYKIDTRRVCLCAFVNCSASLMFGGGLMGLIDVQVERCYIENCTGAIGGGIFSMFQASISESDARLLSSREELDNARNETSAS